MTLQKHPDVLWFHERAKMLSDVSEQDAGPGSVGTAKPEANADNQVASAAALPLLREVELRELCLTAGADDVGFVHVDQPGIGDQRGEILQILPNTATIVSLVFQLNSPSLRSPAHSPLDVEFQQASAHANRTGRAIVFQLRRLGVAAVNLPVGFPFETGRWPGKTWLVADKPVAEAAGVGLMGWHRNVIHPEFGGAIFLVTVLVAARLDAYSVPLEINPCFECKLCVSVCPTGAIASDGHFDFVSCYTHNYRERLGGFQDWVEQLVSSNGTAAYRARVSDAETVSMWQNLSIGAQTKCDKCMAVCPAGRQKIGEYLGDEKAYRAQVADRLRDRAETVYVLSGSDAESSVASRFPQKTVKRVGNGLRPNSTRNFLGALPLIFQRGRAEGLDATYHFVFTGMEPCQGTVVIKDQTITVLDGLVGTADLRVTADGATWIAFLAKEKGLIRALLSRKLKLKGPPRLMSAFARCFPS